MSCLPRNRLRKQVEDNSAESAAAPAPGKNKASKGKHKAREKVAGKDVAQEVRTVKMEDLWV